MFLDDFVITTTGYHWMEILSYEFGLWFKILYVHAKISHIFISCMQQEVTLGETTDCFVTVGQGGSMNISVRVEYANGFTKNNTFIGGKLL